MKFKKPLFLHPADVKAAQSAVKRISEKIQAQKKNVQVMRDLKDAEVTEKMSQKENEVLERVKQKLVEFSQQNPSEAMALLEQLRIRYPNYPWDE